MKQFMNYFPNATELTLTKMFDGPHDSIATNLDRIIPLKQLTKLVLDSYGFSFQHVIELLIFTPNVHALQLDFILLHQTNSTSMQQNKTFQIVSKMNTITNLTIKSKCTLEKIQLITALFPRLECLTMGLLKEDLQSIVRFLLSKTNNNTRYLSLLCVLTPWKDLAENLTILIEEEKLLHDYTLQVSSETLILWW
jgi:hypothetical protein